MRRQFAYHLTRIENIIGKMTARGDEFFEDTIRIGRIFDLLNSDKIKAEFERKVVGDTEEQIDATIHELIDWMVEQDLRTWESVQEYVDRRRLTQYEEEMIGEVGGQFRYDRRSLLESVSNRAKEEVERYDPEQAAHDFRSACAAQSRRSRSPKRVRSDSARSSSPRPAPSRSMSPASWPPVWSPVSASSSCRANGAIAQRVPAPVGRAGRAAGRGHERAVRARLARSKAGSRTRSRPYTRFVRDQQAKFTGIDENCGRRRRVARASPPGRRPGRRLSREAISAGIEQGKPPPRALPAR